jgi:hypothetical protein
MGLAIAAAPGLEAEEGRTRPAGPGDGSGDRGQAPVALTAVFKSVLEHGHLVGADAELTFGRAIAVARNQGARLWELRAAINLARLRCNQSKRAEAYDLLAPIYGWFTEGFETADLKDAKALLDELA